MSTKSHDTAAALRYYRTELDAIRGSVRPEADAIAQRVTESRQGPDGEPWLVVRADSGREGATR